MDGLVDGRRADWRRHERISSDDGGSGRAEAGARSIELCDAALFRGISSEETALSCSASAGGAKVGDNVREMEALGGTVRGDLLGKGKGGGGGCDLLDRVIAEGANDARTLLMLGRSHGDEDGQKYE